MPSRLFIYYNERTLEGTLDSDSGAMIRDGIKSVAKLGVCPEDEWPYDPARFRYRPSAKCFKDAAEHQAVVYRNVLQTLPQLRGCIASGTPVVFGFSVYESFESREVARTGVVPMPERREKQVGGHAVLAVGQIHNDGRDAREAHLCTSRRLPHPPPRVGARVRARHKTARRKRTWAILLQGVG